MTLTKESYDYVIIGGGMAGDAAAKAIRDADARGSILLIGSDPEPPVTRPALSKKLWTDPEFGFEKVWLNTTGETAPSW